MSESVTVALIAAIVSVAAAIPGLYKAIKDGRRQDADVEMSAVTLLIDPLKERIAEQEIEITRMADELRDVHTELIDERTKRRELENRFENERREWSARFDDFKVGARRLINQLHSHDIKPVWMPEED